MLTSKYTINWIVQGLFLLSSAAAVYILYKMPEWMPQYSTAIDLTVVRQLEPLFSQLYIVVATMLITGLGTTYLLIYSRSTASERTFSEQIKASSLEEEIESEILDKVEEKYSIGNAESLVKLDCDDSEIFNKALSEVCKKLEASQAAAFRVTEEESCQAIELFASFAYHIPEGERIIFRFGEGVAGQVAKDGKTMNIDRIPEGYIKILSGLGNATPTHLLLIPIKSDKQVVGVVEIASFVPFEDQMVEILELYFDKLALKLSLNDNVRLEEAKS